MAKNKKYTVKFQRRLTGKTNYRKRLKLVSARNPRIVIRKSLNNFTIQLIEFDAKGDRVIKTIDSRKLKDYGYKAHTGNIPAAYLTGLLFGINLKNKNVDAVLDLGLARSIKKSSIYAALKGIIDAGVKIKHSEEVLPPEERITGKHISGDFVSHFNEVKNKLLKKI